MASYMRTGMGAEGREKHSYRGMVSIVDESVSADRFVHLHILGGGFISSNGVHAMRCEFYAVPTIVDLIIRLTTTYHLFSRKLVA